MKKNSNQNNTENNKNFYHNYSDLLKLLQHSDKPYNINAINKAYEFAFAAHSSQKRNSGDDYILHPVSVAYILAELGMDTPTIVAALLHDTIEDTHISHDDVIKVFGEEVASLVDGVTKLRKKKNSSREEKQGENLDKMLNAMAQDIRVIIIKLADRVQNMRTIEVMNPQKRRDKSLQNMEIFAPIAHRLGIRTIKDELEDVSLKYLDPVAYKEIETALAIRKNDREKFINIIKKRIVDKLKKYFPQIYIEGRAKSLNEIYKKMFILNKTIEQIYDIYAVRIIVDTKAECYNILGFIHNMFQPIPKRFKDYISTPKANMYQSLHTTVLTKEGIPFEIQIRTWKMHKTAEYGIAAHWKYKFDNVDRAKALEGSLSWLNRMLENYKEIGNVTDFVGNIKLDLMPESIHAFTPTGDIINLPAGATVIDFAYAIHTDLGNKATGAFVNKKIVPVTHIIKEGNIVDILTSEEKSYGPNRNWINIVKTSEAKNKIKSWLKNEKKEENIEVGKKEIKKLLEVNKIFLTKDEFHRTLNKFLEKYKCETIDDLLAMVGYGGASVWSLVYEIKKLCKKDILNNFLSSFSKAKEDKKCAIVKEKIEIIAKNTPEFLINFIQKISDLKIKFKKITFDSFNEKITVCIEAEFENEKTFKNILNKINKIENVEIVNKLI